MIEFRVFDCIFFKMATHIPTVIIQFVLGNISLFVLKSPGKRLSSPKKKRPGEGTFSEVLKAQSIKPPGPAKPAKFLQGLVSFIDLGHLRQFSKILRRFAELKHFCSYMKLRNYQMVSCFIYLYTVDISTNIQRDSSI